MTVSSADHVFVVGLSRSGTTLVRHILNSHSKLAIAPESHYLGHQFPGAGVRAVLRQKFPERHLRCGGIDAGRVPVQRRPGRGDALAYAEPPMAMGSAARPGG